MSTFQSKKPIFNANSYAMFYIPWTTYYPNIHALYFSIYTSQIKHKIYIFSEWIKILQKYTQNKYKQHLHREHKIMTNKHFLHFESKHSFFTVFTFMSAHVPLIYNWLIWFSKNGLTKRKQIFFILDENLFSDKRIAPMKWGVSRLWNECSVAEWME